MKGLTVLTEVVFLAVVISIVFLVYAMATPTILSMQTASVFEQTKSFMIDIDRTVQDVASGGRGTRKSIDLTIGAGTLELDENKDKLGWNLKTDSMIISPRSMQQLGNLLIGSNLDAMAYENSSASAYVLENEHLIVHLKKIGSASSQQVYNTSELLMGVYNKDIGAWLDMNRLDISIDDNAESTNGTGYTELVTVGYALSSAEFVAHINTSYSLMDNYTMRFTLESGADFLMIGAEA